MQRVNHRTAYIDVLSVLAALAVVSLHTNGCFWQFSATERYWKTANIIEGLCYFAVPIFFMINGATLIDYRSRYSTVEFFKKRVMKTVIPFISWSLIGILFRLYYLKDLKIEELSMRWIVQGINHTSIVASLYWFFPALFSVYLAIPVLSVIPEEKRKAIFSYIVAAGFTINILFPFILEIMDLSKPAFKMIFASNYLIYVLAGYLLSHYELRKKWRRILILLGLGGVVLQIYGTYVGSVRSGSIYSGFRGYENVPAFLYSIAVFLLVRYHCNDIRSGIGIKFINTVRNYTFPIYLLHWFVYQILLKELSIDTRSIAYRIGAPIPICIIVIAITYLVRKMPVIKNILP